jgi:Fibronectin type III domain
LRIFRLTRFHIIERLLERRRDKRVCGRLTHPTPFVRGQLQDDEAENPQIVADAETTGSLSKPQEIHCDGDPHRHFNSPCDGPRAFKQQRSGPKNANFFPPFASSLRCSRRTERFVKRVERNPWCEVRMKPSLLSAFLLSVSALACGTTTDPVREPPPARPSAVSILNVSANDGTVAITFTQTNSAAAPSVQYQVTCQSSSAKYTATGKASPITLTGLTNGVRYSCTVTAVDAIGTSDPSPAVVITYNPEMFFLLTPGNGSATVAYDFTADSRPWLVAVTCNAPGSQPVTTTRADSVVSLITITGLENGVSYSCGYRITSASGVAISRQLDVVPGTPVRPLDPRATPGNAGVTLRFQASTDNGSPVTSYTATCEAAGQESRTVNGASSPIVVNGLANGVEYSCNVYGTSALGPGEKSASMLVTPGVPGAVTSITVTTTRNSATFSFSPPDSDNGSPITSYTAWCDPVGPSPGTGSSGPASPITVTGLFSNALYQCSLYAKNANGIGATTYISVTTQP